ncbi:pentapeptide repeat-containing protein [Leptothoe sp. EHU-05/26/07-4]
MTKLPQWVSSRINWIKSPPRWAITVGSICLGSVGTVSLLWFLLVLLPNRNVPVTVSEDAKRRADLINSNRNNVLQVAQTIAGLGFIATAYLAWQNYKLTEDKNVTDRFSKAVEMLASEKIEVRLGGIYSLERIARDSKEDHPVVMEVLTAFIREKSPHQVESYDPYDQEDAYFKEEYRADPENFDALCINEDIQSVLSVIGRRNSSFDSTGRIIKLPLTRLFGVELTGANLEKARISRADLGAAELVGANLANATLVYTLFDRANLQEATLRQADLHGADLVGACLVKTNLYSANLTHTNLMQADLEGADLKKAKLIQAKLFKANLTGTNLTGAALEGANLQKIRWSSETVWPDKEEVAKATDIPEKLKQELGITSPETLSKS